jgi:glutamine synthetase
MKPEHPDDPRRVASLIRSSGLELVRLSWCDTHGMLRGKTLSAEAAIRALDSGVSMVSTLLLKDTSDRTVYRVFEAETAAELHGLGHAGNVQLMPDPNSFRILPWADRTGWLQCQPLLADGQVAGFDTRWQLQRALARLAERGLGLRCGLEVEFHIYKLLPGDRPADRDPRLAAWPGPAPEVELIHPGYNLLSEALFDQAEAPLRIVQRTAEALGLPLLSLEIELGPSQVEAVFDVTDALQAADNMVIFRSAVRQALRHEGYHATFMCRPPFAHIMSSGWHLHQSLDQLATGANSFARPAPLEGSGPLQAGHWLSEIGCAYLAGLLSHARGMTLLCTPTVNGLGRFRPHALAPQHILWGHDNRGAMLRVIGGPGDRATRIENRLGEPAANPYLYMASQIYAGLSGIDARRVPPLATTNPYGEHQPDGHTLPTRPADALQALLDDPVLRAGFSQGFLDYYGRIRASEQARHAAAEDTLEFERREYFNRI